MSETQAAVEPVAVSEPPKFKPEAPFITRRDAAKSRKPGLRSQKVVCCINASWWDGYSKQWRAERHSATKHTIASALLTFSNPDTQFHFLTEEDLKPRRRCLFANTVPAQLQSLIKATPKNSTVRAMIMNQFGEMPPENAKTFDEIKDWIEFNFPKGGASSIRDLSISFRKSYETKGKVNRTRWFEGSGLVTLSPQSIQELVKKVVASGGQLKDVFDEIKNSKLNDVYVRYREFDSHSEADGPQVESVPELSINYSNNEQQIVMDLALSVLSEEEFDKFVTEPDNPMKQEEEDEYQEEEENSDDDGDGN